MTQEFQFRLQIKGPDKSWVFDIPTDAETIYIGREAGVEVLLEQKQVSRRHAAIHCTSTECQIVDLKSANGTRVNGQKLAPQAPVVLKRGDSIQISDFNLEFEQIPIEDEAPLEEAELPEVPRFEVDPLMGDEPEIPPPPPPDPLLDILTPPIDPSQQRNRITFIGDRLLSYLPGIYHTDFMGNFLASFEAVLFPIEWQIDNFDLFLDPGTAPASFLPWLANWFEAGFDSTWSEAQKRTFLKEAYSLYARTGTREALCRVLEIYCGYRPEVDDEAEDLAPHTFRVKLRQVTPTERKSIERLINAYKPTHTSYVLELPG